MSPAAPKQFWQPLDNNNERLLELITRPDRIRSDTYPAPEHVYQEMLKQVQHNDCLEAK